MPSLTQAPASSLIARRLAGANFSDAWCIEITDTGGSALSLFIESLSVTPRWVERCMALRNRMATVAGLKDLGALSAIDPGREASVYRPGDRVGVFTLIHNSREEVLLGDRDKHLDVTLSVHRRSVADGRVLVTVTTVVHVHNGLGRLYMFVVKPLHRRIAPAVLRALAE